MVNRIRAVRSKPRPGRLRGAALEQLRRDCFERDNYRCVVCNTPVNWEGYQAGHMAHVHGKRNSGDSLENVVTKCAHCHIVIEHGGNKPCPAKERAA